VLRITSVSSPSGEVELRLEGRLVGRWVGLTRRICLRALDDGSSVTVDLAGVAFIDRDGVALIRDLTDRGVSVVHCSPFVGELLRGVTPC